MIEKTGLRPNPPHDPPRHTAGPWKLAVGQAVEMFQATLYDLILMDVQMPVLDGHAATRAIREIEASAEHQREAIPIIALTAHAIKEEQDKSLAAGCNAHLTKPIKKQILIDALADFVA